MTVSILQLSTPPNLIALHATHRSLFPALFQSCGTVGWDILLALPASIRTYAYHEATDFINDLTQLPLSQDSHAAICDPSVDLPFLGGWAVYIGYEALHLFEPTVPIHTGNDFPIAALVRCPAAVLINRTTEQAWLVAENKRLLKDLIKHIEPSIAWEPTALTVTDLYEDDPEIFLQGIKACKHYIYEGDLFQINLSRAWQATLRQGSAVDLYTRLRGMNPAPFSALLDLGQHQIISASPERLVSMRDDWIETRPIAGTRPRSADPIEDALLKTQLLNTSKERAEHIMLVDLARNDLGKLAQPGSITVDELMAVTTYPFVHHIESTIRARLRPNQHVSDILQALFPGGTITGCPKIRCMQIIYELEQQPRYAYTGSLGYINLDGSLDLNILIRTVMQSDKQLYFRAGAGIVADSDPEHELMETRHKARGLLHALGMDTYDAIA